MKFAPVLLLGIALSTTSAAFSQDAVSGAAVFRKCIACHVADEKTNKIGPHLGDVIGRTAGTVPDFSYSDAMKSAGKSGLLWDDATLSEYLAAPKAKVPGTKMAFVGLKKSEDIQNVIAYLKSISELPQ